VHPTSSRWRSTTPSVPPKGSRYLEQTAAGLLAINTHARAGLPGAVLGSQATAIVSISPVPVLVAPQARDSVLWVISPVTYS
jgi:hypothetical protein